MSDTNPTAPSSRRDMPAHEPSDQTDSASRAADAEARESEGVEVVVPSPTLGTLVADLGPVVTVLLIVSAVAPVAGSLVLFWKIAQVRDWVNGLGSSGAVIVGALFALTTGCALMPTYALSAFCGFAFGAVTGSWVAVAGITGGAVIGYTLGLVLAQGRVLKVIEQHPRASVIRRAITDRSFVQEFGVITLLRLPPNSPFALTNFVLSATRVRFLAFLAGTPVGMAPRTVLAALIGAGLAEAADAVFSKDALGEAAPGWVLPVGIGLAVVVIAVLYKVIGGWITRALEANGLLDATSDPSAAARSSK